MTKYQALHSHDIQLCIHVCHKQTDIYIFHQANMTKRTEQVVFLSDRKFSVRQKLTYPT